MSSNSTEFVTILEFARRSSLSRGTIYNMIARRELPEPVRLTQNRVAFPGAVVDEWFSSRRPGLPASTEAHA